MEMKRYKPQFDKLYFCILIPTNALIVALFVVALLTSPGASITVGATLVFVNYFLLSPAFGYLELREDGVFIKFGFVMKRYIPYKTIRGIEKKRQFHADSMLSLKNAIDHVNIKYNKFDMVSVSVKGSDELVAELCEIAGVSLAEQKCI